jgi:hypothetical protein
MAYVSQERKSQLAPTIKAICKKYDVKATLAVRHHSTLVLNIKSSSIDFIGNYNETVEQRPGGFRNGSPAKDSIQLNPYWYQEHFSGKALEFLSEVIPAMNNGNWDKSEPQTDYFNVGWYVDVNVGQWDKPFELVK